MMAWFHRPRKHCLLGLPAASTGFASLIVAVLPTLFAEFRGKRFTMLWRDSRDRFGAGSDWSLQCTRGEVSSQLLTRLLIRETVFGGIQRKDE
jgi:hypothetical protein